MGLDRERHPKLASRGVQGHGHNDCQGWQQYTAFTDSSTWHLEKENVPIHNGCYRLPNENHYDYFNLGTSVGYSVLQVVNAYSKPLGRELPHQYAPRREGDVEILTASPTKATTVLNWKTELGLVDMCRDSLNFITKKHQAK
jgi:GDP-D-mannose dehydratase